MTSSHRVSARRLLFAAFLVGGLALCIPLGCDDNPEFSPLPPEPPAHGTVVAGTVYSDAASVASGVVVTLEPMTNGVAASVQSIVRQVRENTALGKSSRDVAATTATSVRATVTDS